ncbi:MAG: PleD family two-component system response regulator [Rickettsiaceae bacterium]|nr:PleD family two-component system response regulator [Rickettsiaceae bacterium]MDP4832790.1 PleD family two-component system response regulator [Rickettsiaceae bacterium]MDP5020908.1 PleD family two-component system response regulator [Rickettsiaceae bacterium]MDP5082740.1 PleD family two-component system response regulator [Rickettsiaceae bacterium]
MTATVLVVDDLDANVKLLEAKLLSEYYTVVTATNGVKALSALKENKIDIVLLDVMMPEMDGFETCTHIKSNPDTTHIPVVMVTALSDIEDRVKGLEAGADEFLTKPINDTALFARVKSLTRMKTVIDELKLRNNTVSELGGKVLVPKQNFADSKILLIDDDVIQAKNIKASLSTLSEQVQVLASPDEIDSLGSFIPDVVIISCQIDVVDPLRIGVMLRSKPVFKNAVLMLLAEEENIAMVIKGMELGINDYFIYPVDKSELQARIKTQLRRKYYQDNLRTELEESVDLSTKDGLTGLFNRRYFDIHIKQMSENAQTSGKAMCMMILDMDHFKEVNDNYGHPAGDAVLRTLANTLKSLFRVTDLIARYGGEEFVVLLGNVDLAACANIAEKTRIAIESADFIIPGQSDPLKKTASIGIAELEPGESVEDFITRADRAMYEAKESGRNKVVAD